MPLRGSGAAAAQPPATWQMRVPLDSGAVSVAVTSRAATVNVVAPTGTFQQSFGNAAPITGWADDAERLAVPQPASAQGAGASVDPTARLRYASTRLAPAQDTAARLDLTEFVLTRVDSGPQPAYLLTGSNGAWTFAMRLRPEQGAALIAALRGRAHPGALPYETRRFKETTDATGAWLSAEVDRMVAPGRRPPRPAYPSDLRGERVKGSVRLSFIVEPTGRVRPSSIRLIGRAHPALALAARQALLGAEYTPAQMRGKAVPQDAMQQFEFSP
jgi:TonB family protein